MILFSRHEKGFGMWQRSTSLSPLKHTHDAPNVEKSEHKNTEGRYKAGHGGDTPPTPPGFEYEHPRTGRHDGMNVQKTVFCAPVRCCAMATVEAAGFSYAARPLV